MHCQRCEFRHCKICAWRRSRIQSDPFATDAPEGTCDSFDPGILAGLHLKPSRVWIDIIDANRLCSPNVPVMRQGHYWVSIPLRCPTTVQHSNSFYMHDGDWQHLQDKVKMFHNTKLESLVRPTRIWTGESIGNGILLDGRLRYGNGVNVYSPGGLETFDESPGWVQLELRCTNTTKFKGGRGKQYSFSGPSGEPCSDVDIYALWVRYPELPPIVFLA